MDKNKPTIGSLLTLLNCLFLTAFCSLIYQLVWCRELSHVFGNTAFASSSVLSVFMGGLAIGSLCAGRIIEARKNLSRFLGFLFIMIGLSCISTIFLIRSIGQLQQYLFSVYDGNATLVIRICLFLATSIVLIIPTFLIGIAFPLIVQLYNTVKIGVRESISICYWIDTLGASLGMLIASFVIAPHLGYLKTSIIASSLNVLIGFFVLIFLRIPTEIISTSNVSTSENLPQASELRGVHKKIIFFFFFLSGFAALILEVNWIRHWELVFGSGIHAFAIVIVTFLVGLSLGSLLYNIFLKRIKNQALLFSNIEFLLFVSSILITILFPYLEKVFLKVYYSVDNYTSFITLMGLLCFLILIIPTALMGMTLPALSAVFVSVQHVGKDFGKLYAVNSMGALLGSFCAGFIIIPALGIYKSSFFAGSVYAFVALGFLFFFCNDVARRLKTHLCYIGLFIIMLFLVVTFYLPDHLYTGVFYTGTSYDESGYQEYLKKQRFAASNLRYRRDGIYGQTTVTGKAPNLMLRTNGRIDSGTTGDLASYQSLLGHIPMILRNESADVLNIGFGCGWTVRGVTMHPVLKTIDCVEINPLVIDVNKNVFHSYNDDVIFHPKLNIILNDGRNYLQFTEKKYDVIISEPTDLAGAGTAALFTQQFYLSAKNQLKEGGLMCQWFPSYEVPESGYKIILKTIKSVFSYAYEFDISNVINDGYYDSKLIVATSMPLEIAKQLELQKTTTDGLPENYIRYRVSLIELIKKTIARNNEDIEAYISEVKTINTDDLPVLEFSSSKTRFRKFREE